MAELTQPDASLPRLPPNLDGHHGSNRGRHGIRQIAADTDLEAIGLWLAEYASSPHTLRSYRKEALRLLIWATRTQRKPVSSLTREDLLAYEAFLTSPPADWVDAERPRHGADRRLFAGPLSPRSVRQAMGILSGLFNYLVAAGYLAGSPLALRRQRSHGVSRRSAVERYLSQDLWQFVLDFIDTLPQATARDWQHYERAHWLFRLLYGAALRASEVAQAKAGDLYQRRGRWWLAVVGKGGVAGDIPIGEALMADFARYRSFQELPTVPSADETTPLILSIAGATDRPRHIQKNLRHASIETTAIYLHAEDDRRHAETTGTRRRDT